jgi:transposase
MPSLCGIPASAKKALHAHIRHNADKNKRIAPLRLTDFLHLPDFRVDSLSETEHDYHGRNEILVHDLPSHGKRVGIDIDAPRYRCKTCGKAFMGELPGVNTTRRMTERLVRWIGEQSLKHTIAHVADEVGLDEKTVRNVFHDHVADLTKPYRFETPDVLGIDEIHLIKPRCLLTNVSQGTVVHVLKDRNKDTVTAYLAGLKDKQRIRTVSMDMWRPYKDAVELVRPHSVVVIGNNISW